MTIPFTPDLWTVLLVMLTGGIIGGIVNFFYAPLPNGQPNSLGRCVILGIGASALVPVFLFVTQSKILDKLFYPAGPELSAADKAINLLVFISLCLLAAISSSRFIASVSDRVIAQLKEEVKEAKEEIDQTRKDVQATRQTAAEANQKIQENTATLRGLKEVQKARTLAPARRSAASASTLEVLNQPTSASHPDDPQKGRWGGLAVREGYQLSATVEAVDNDNDFFTVHLQVTAPDSVQLPADAIVVFHLHDSFTPDEHRVMFQQRAATLALYAWGAFTVGAEAPGGIHLELDLADPNQVPTAPQSFRNR
ncbi:YEATS-associated helix-containing protein [Spirosoma sp. 209]|uniref:YEATS-associated helix-containing protein n=1 Tax=Spirosoma sp. 209 TaxID=1955701 RepID=UPI00098D6A44|nr:YEATS-associated helix-containing protein [Spirosoma sp. 209]